MAQKKEQPPKRSLKDLEDQALDLLREGAMPELDDIEIPEELKNRVDSADLAGLEELEKELGIDESAVGVYAEAVESGGVVQADVYRVGEDDESSSEGSPAEGRCSVRISEDRMMAEMDFSPSERGGAPLTLDYVKEVLETAGVRHGVNDALLRKVIKSVEKTKEPKRSVVVARGTPPEEGREGSIEYRFSEDESILLDMDGKR